MTSPSGHHRSACCGWGCSENSGLADPRPDELSLPIWRRLPVHLSYHSRRSSVPSSYRRFDQLRCCNVWPQRTETVLNKVPVTTAMKRVVLIVNDLSYSIKTRSVRKSVPRFSLEHQHHIGEGRRFGTCLVLSNKFDWFEQKISTWIRQLLNAGHFRVSHSLWWR